jgi:hypothetical protein
MIVMIVERDEVEAGLDPHPRCLFERSRSHVLAALDRVTLSET